MGLAPIFCLWGVMQKAPGGLVELVERTVTPMGYEVVGVELAGSGERGRVLRVYIDQEEGITLDDCAAVSHQLSGVLDVEDPIREHYRLEVSSPGLDRPLFTPAQFERFAGHEVRIRLARLIDRRRKLSGVLRGVRGDAVLVEVEGAELAIPLADIESARLVPEF
jgi:ribosome maturation factor RimP